MSEIKVNKISPRTNCGTVQLGDSGDTITIPAGASITNSGTASGFGATGSASWVTTKKTATFTATAGEGYFCDTSGGAFTVNLPSSPSAGAVVAVADYANTFDTNNLTIGRGGSNIEGEAADFVCNQEGVAITFVYVDATKGWIATDTGNSSNAFKTEFIVATGGTITTSGNYKIHTFTGPGTFTVCAEAAVCGASRNTVSYMVVAGGASGGAPYGGGGGAGGFREYKGPADCYTASPLDGNPGGTAITVAAGGYPITVGAGGPGVNADNRGASGSNSVFSTVTSAGGGGGGGSPSNGGIGQVNTGGSGGGGGSYSPVPYSYSSFNCGAAGNTPPVSPPQGNTGGKGVKAPNGVSAGGGGGAGAVGGDVTSPSPGPNNTTGGPGGAGATTSITGSPVAYAGGGGGSTEANSSGKGAGGTGGGGDGFYSPGVAAASGTANTGGGGGGAGPNPSGAGGSGIVVIRYKFQ
jgi:hypothetical protein